MQDKINFGKYIAEKRKKKGLTQEELASRLYVIPTTISKWERGISYPDINVIVKLCKELDISEHEFFIACDDEATKEEKREIQRYRTLKKWMLNILNLGYIIGIISCFICNLAINHTLSWFLIALLGILISFSITSLPFYLKNNKYKFCKIAFIVTILIYLLLFTINYVNNGSWLIESFLIASFVFSFLWLAILIGTFTKIAFYYKVAISLVMVAFISIFTNPFCAKVLEIPDNGNNIYNFICAVIMIIIALYMSLKQLLSKKES